MKDYRKPENRLGYFTDLYDMNLIHGVMPGLVYLYMPRLAEHFDWNDEQKLWFAREDQQFKVVVTEEVSV